MPDARWRSDPLSAADLAAFAAAVELGSVRGAADALALTQSAATKRIQRLERRVGLTLLERGRFGVKPTEAGGVLYPEARQALDALTHAATALDELRAGSAVGLSLSASQTTGEFLVPGWLATFRATQPDVRARVHISNSPSVVADIREGRAEIGFVEGVDALDGLQVLTLQRDEIVAVVAPGHPWATRRGVPAAALAGPGVSYVTRELGSGNRSVAAAALAEIGITLSPTMETTSNQSIKRALLDMRSRPPFALLSELAVEDERRAGSLIVLRVRGVDLRRDLRAICRRRPVLSGPARGFWKALSALAQLTHDRPQPVLPANLDA